MAITNEQYERLLNRVTAIEQHLNDVMVALDKFSTREQITQLQVILEQDVDTIQQQVDALELRVTAVEEEPLT